jgi:pre-mRNA-splicing factor SYF1
MTKTRKIFDRALQNLPVTQHKLIWDRYLEWAISLTDHDDEPFSDIAVHVFRRYSKLEPYLKEDMISYLLSVDRVADVIQVYEEVLQ